MSGRIQNSVSTLYRCMGKQFIGDIRSCLFSARSVSSCTRSCLLSVRNASSCIHTRHSCRLGPVISKSNINSSVQESHWGSSYLCIRWSHSGCCTSTSDLGALGTSDLGAPGTRNSYPSRTRANKLLGQIEAYSTTTSFMMSSLDKQTGYTREKVSEDDQVVQSLLAGIKASSRGALAQSITLAESTHPLKRAQAQVLLKLVLAHRADISAQTGRHSFRLGISGPPGSGKSTHIEAVGKMLTSMGHKVAVLAVDPSSSTTGGSLLGDKTRMPELSRDPNAYIRPSPSSGNLGGVTRVTNDAIILCEGAGYDLIIVETVGVGQSEFAVADMVDMFELLIPPAGGDELQGIKKGIVEVADIVVVNKSDGELVAAARHVHSEYASALKFIRAKSKNWRPCVMRVSSTTKDGLPELWATISDFRHKMMTSGEFAQKRRRQQVLWMRAQIQEHLSVMFREHRQVQRIIPRLEALVEAGSITPGLAADISLQVFTTSLQRVSEGEATSNKEKGEEEDVNEILRNLLVDLEKER